ncbi:hypothetical protein [Haloarcula sp. JP-L23]|uniref:hypothetical protein n=1 Tax=Haloarcula sp. JP-L23 TaxID=2716717 RepID=UPI00140F4CDC|nr:hypothetical protein G9465_24420 [Haloarcula sp. JP-L23]
MDDDETVRLQGTIPKSLYEELADKFPASAEAGDSNLIRAMADRLERLEELEEMRATGTRPSETEQE